MYISQPALSKTLQRFEEGIGLKLFYRSNQGVTLTAEGEYLFSTLEPLYNNIDKTISTAKNISDALPRTLHIVEPATYDASPDFGEVKTFVRNFEEKYPDVVLLESLCDFTDLRRSLEFGDAHLAITQDFAIVAMKGISYKAVSSFRLNLAMASDHPLAVYDELMPELASQYTFYRVPALGEDEDRRLTIERCHKVGIEPKAIEFVPNFPTLFHKIRSKKGISICGRFAFAESSDAVKYIQLKDLDDLSTVVVAWRTDNLSPEAKSLVQLIPGDVVNA
jgi:DNA-binding transcriptional LysR family regulator